MTREEGLNLLLEAIAETNSSIKDNSLTDDKMRNHLLNQISAYLADIATSLARICDKYKED